MAKGLIAGLVGAGAVGAGRSSVATRQKIAPSAHRPRPDQTLRTLSMANYEQGLGCALCATAQSAACALRA